MKKNFFNLLSILLLVSFSNSVKAQYGFEVNYGLNGVLEPSISNVSHFGAGFFYDFDESFGAKIDFGSDKFRTDVLELNEETGLDITRFSIQGTMNVTTLFSRASSYDTFNLIAHAGGGYSMIKSTFGGANDNVLNLIGGITPRFRITDGLYFAVDASAIFNISQHYNFDGTLSYTDAVNSFTGITYNFTGGIIYKFSDY